MSFKHSIDDVRCKGCGLCVEVCPKHVLALSKKVNIKGYTPAFQARPEDCIKCSACCIMCPDVAITIDEIEDEIGDEIGDEVEDETAK